eukprot:GHUV01015741.1.p1 GENE.GHUV01015741.1~~GHUV01015741.1.p1  ORF type:complete len:184 (+),score=52.55 GHUV01015741.1:517-1068(+)
MPNEGQLFEVMQCIDDYLVAQERLSSALKDGWFSIARGKYSLGSALGQQRYPGDMEATTLVHTIQGDTEDGIYDAFELHACSRRSSDAGPAKKEQHTAAEDDTAQPDADSSRRRSNSEQRHHQVDPVSWFAALPPPPVRQAQKDFLTVLQRVVAAANAVQQLRHSADTYTEGSQDDAASTAAS